MPTGSRSLWRWIRAFGARLGVLLPLCAALPGCDSASTPRRPDVCVLLVDTLRADHLGLYGYPRDTSPNLDAFAAGSVVFEDVVAPSSWTMPSVASLMTSTYPSVHGLRTRTGQATNALHPRLATLAEAMQEAGYHTVGLVANPWVSPAQGLHRGFAEYEVFSSKTSAGNLNYVARKVLDSRGSAPVFLYVHYMDVHGPYDTAPPLALDALGPVPPELNRAMTPGERRSIPSYLRLRGAPNLGAYVHAYDSGIRAWDRAFGEWMDWLDESGRSEHTIVAVTADHGEELLDHGGWNHGTNLKQESIWIPWILRVPGRAPERIADRTVSLIDLAPTLLASVGAGAPDTMEGADALGGAVASPPRALFSETEVKIGGFPDAPRRAVRRGPLKLIRTPDREECFDLALDPAEQKPLADGRCGMELAPALETWQRDARERSDALGPAPAGTLDAATQEELRALGYAE